MASFPSIQASFGIQKSSKPNTKIVKLGDGYEHRLLFGLNQNPKIYSLKWENISETDSDTIETFLDARAVDSASFTYQPPGEGTSYNFVCDSWNKKIDFANIATITAEFREVFEP
tara:strand:+ start:336 stop:680 length:345 start_codon:yes stop_codon:yes gene_type:complete